MSDYYLEFEKPIQAMEKSIGDLKKASNKEKGIDFSIEIAELEKKLTFIIETTYRNLTPWQVTQVARHPERPQFTDYLKQMFTDFLEIAGDRYFKDDKSIITGFAKIEGQKFVVVGEERGKNTKERIRRNFGSPNPEGYRKAIRAMKLAEKYKLPILTFVDTNGAMCGIESEERGQGEAIARNLFEMSALKTPIVTTVLGEGGSGGALAIAVADRVLMLENSIYSVISPEGCASIMWHDATKAPKAAEILKLTAKDLLGFQVIEEIIPEPLGGAHRNYELTMDNVKKAILSHVEDLRKIQGPKLAQKRYERFRKLGAVGYLKQ
jgi:acetyl-CoA carboxylase carboxyl transferase subunit alpha